MKNYLMILQIALLITTVNEAKSQQLVQPYAPISGDVQVEVVDDSIVCFGVKRVGHPADFGIRTNRPDLFFNDDKKIKKCILEAKRRLENKRTANLYHIPLYPRDHIITPYTVGSFEGIMCFTFVNNEELPIVLEFSLPWFAKNEIDFFGAKESLQMCIKNAKRTFKIPSQGEKV